MPSGATAAGATHDHRRLNDDGHWAAAGDATIAVATLSKSLVTRDSSRKGVDAAATKGERSHGGHGGHDKARGNGKQLDETARKLQAAAAKAGVVGGMGSTIHVRFPPPIDGAPIVTYDNSPAMVMHSSVNTSPPSATSKSGSGTSQCTSCFANHCLKFHHRHHHSFARSLAC